MTAPVHNLSQEQKMWYAELVIAAIVADNEISLSEIKFLKQVMGLISDMDQKKKLLTYVSSKKAPTLSPPDNINNDILAAIYIELILIMISDLDFAIQERDFLSRISDLFNFSESYFDTLMEWAEKGLKWKKDQRLLLISESDELGVPLKRMNSDQRRWYANIMIATILLDRSIDEFEIELLKTAISVVDDQNSQKELLSYIKNKMCPPIKPPPDSEMDILIAIITELLLLISADENVTYQEQAHLRRIAECCEFPEDKFDSMLDWCNEGVEWKRSKTRLIKQVNFRKTPKVNRDKNVPSAIKMGCFVCNTDEEIRCYLPDPGSPTTEKNIFGIPVYPKVKKEENTRDYNQIAITVCPTCYFAGEGDRFFKKEDDPPLIKELVHKKFREFWMKEVEQRSQAFEKTPNEVFSTYRSFPTVRKSYQIAIKALIMMRKINNSIDNQMIHMSLILKYAEVLTNGGDQTNGDKLLLQVRSMAKNTVDSELEKITGQKVHCAQLLFFLSLYYEEEANADKYRKYLLQTQKDKASTIQPAELSYLKKLNQKLLWAFEHQQDYSRTQLNGYCLKKGFVQV